MKINVRQEMIKELRLSKGWTQENLAERSGVHSRTVQRIESDGVASVQSLNALAGALAVGPSILQKNETKKHAIARQAVQYQHRRVPKQFTAISSRQRHTVKQFLQQTERMESWRSNEWVAWVILLIGSFLTVSVIMMTQTNWSPRVIFHVLLPGTAIGTLLMLLGGFHINMSTKAQEQKVLASLLQPEHRDRSFKPQSD